MTPVQIQDELLHWVDEKMATIRNEIFSMKGSGLGLALAASIDIFARV